MIFSRRAVNNALTNKLEQHYGKKNRSVKTRLELAVRAGNQAGASGSGGEPLGMIRVTDVSGRLRMPARSVKRKK